MPKGIYERTEQHKENCRQLLVKMRDNPNFGMKGKHHTNQTKQKISNKLKMEQIGFKRGYIPWNKGLTKETDLRVAKLEHKVSLALKNKPKPWQSNENSRFWRGGISHCYNRKLSKIWWKIQRNRCLKRDEYTCKRCGCKNKELHIHHIIPWYIYENNKLSNLITLCESCHMKIEREYDKKNN
jgi:5-methylcytosine-specific restriction endonuclease McrA